ncbi:MAG: hypothetical protein CSA70_03225 [Rhodobacterales bacterium]|nr:MAG: hypothetical protein CSA70_03225 [Rhodobacterales bacterium]
MDNWDEIRTACHVARLGTVSGELVVTPLAPVGRALVPALIAFQTEHLGVVLRFLTGERLFRLEYGEAHVTIRAGGAVPDQPDNVVQPFFRQQTGLYASKSYIARMGHPSGLDDLNGHPFVAVANRDSHAPFAIWMRAYVDLHRTAKVQAFLKFLKSWFADVNKGWNG